MKAGLKELIWSYFVGILALSLLVLLKGKWPAADAAIPEISMIPQATSIRVRIVNDLRDVEIRGRHLQFQKRPYAMVPAKLNGDESVRIARADVGGKSVWVIHQNNRVQLVNAPALFVSGENILAQGNDAPNELVLWPKKTTNNIDVLAVIDIEKYLEGVLPAEMSPSWPLEALKAQAVAARTYALFKRDAREENPFDLESTTDDQVYKVRNKSVSKVLLAKVANAVRSTAGLVLNDSHKEFYPAYFHADCGGATDSPKVIWKMAEAGVSVKDSFCHLRQGAFWKFKVSQSRFMEKLKSQLAKQNRNLPEGARSLAQIQILERSPVGRVLSLRLRFDNNSELDIGGEEIRRNFGFTRLKSTRFDFKVTSTYIEVEGRGFGHGVGMCQHGAKALAEKGQSFDKILKHYYPAARLVPRPDPTAMKIASDRIFPSVDARH